MAPAKAYLVRLGDSEAVTQAADELYERLTSAGTAVLYDDRDMRAGEKFADADLLGIPYRIVISDKTVAGRQHELKQRTATETRLMSLDEIIKTLAL